MKKIFIISFIVTVLTGYVYQPVVTQAASAIVNNSPVLTVTSDGDKSINLKSDSNTFTITGKVSDPDGDPVTTSASIGGVVKNVIVYNTSTPQSWSLTWMTAELQDNEYSNISVTATDSKGAAASAVYNGKLRVDKSQLYYWDQYSVKDVVKWYRESRSSREILRVDGIDGYPEYRFYSGSGTFEGVGYQDSAPTYPTWAGTTRYKVFPFGKGVMEYRVTNEGNVDVTEITAVPDRIEKGKGSLLQSNILAIDKTYPDDGVYTDGLWYVKKSINNQSPTITVNDEDKIIGDSELRITGTVKDVDNETVLISATIGGVSKTTSIAATSTPTDWALHWAGSELLEGKYTSFSIIAIDGKGGTGTAAYKKTIIVDRTGPSEPLIQVIPNGWGKEAKVTIAPGQDALSGVKETLYQIADGSWQPYKEPFMITDEGSMVIKTKSIDQVGNSGEESDATARVDRTPPQITTSLQERPWSTEDITLQLKYKDALSGLDLNQILYKVTNSPDEPQNWDSAAGEEQQIQIDQEGEWYVHAKAADQAGNTAVIQTKALQLQKQPAAPQLSLVQADETSAKLEWTLPSGTTLTDGYRYQLKNVTTGDVFEVQYPDNNFIDPKLSPGQTYEYQVKAINHVGESAYSNTVQVQTLPTAPAEIKIEKVDRQADRALVTIQPVESATSYRFIAKDSKTQQEAFNEVVQGTKQLVTNLKPGTVYDISAAAINGGGQGQAVHAGFLTLPDEPGAFKAAQIGEKDIYLEWNSVDTAEKYGLDRYDQSIYEGKDTAYHDQDLESGSRYNYAVSATNATGFGDYSTLENVWTLPAAVEELRSKTVSTTEIDLSWPAVRGATGYIVSIDGQEIIQPADSTAYQVKGLTPGGTYEIGVRAVNDSGSGATKTVTVSTLPEAPAKSEVNEIQEQSAKLTFTGADGATRYRVVVNGKTYDIADTELQITGLTGGKTYEYSVAAGNSAGFGQELKGTFLTLPQAPAGLSAKEHTARSLTLSWEKTESANGYIVLDDQGNVLGTTEANEYTVTGLTPGSKHVYFVKAQNATGEGAATKFSWRTIPDAEAAGLTLQVNQIGTHEVEISWSAVPGADGYVLYDEKGQQLAKTEELKAKAEQLQSATKYAGWTMAPFNSTGPGKALEVPAFETQPSAEYTVKATPKETNVSLEFAGDLSHEIFVVEQGGKEIYRGEKPEMTAKNLKSGTKYTFTVWTENSAGEQSEKKNVVSTTLMPVYPPMTGGNGGGTDSHNPGDTVDPPKKETPADDKEGSKGGSKDDSNSDPINGQEKTPFTDLDQAFNQDQIESLYKMGIVKGTSTTTFEPKRPITRVEFMSLIVRALDIKPGEVGLTFQDIDLEAWYIPELKTAVKNGVAKGFSSTIFRPFDPITREQASKMLGNVLYSKLPDPEGKEMFKDGQNIAFWAKNEVLGLTAEQLITGYPDGTFRPKNNLTRAESIALIYRTLQK